MDITDEYDVTPSKWESHRQRTAIGRPALSMPLRMSILDGVVRGDQSLLDYGSGRGQDVSRLRSMGYDICGWDPHYAPDHLPRDREVVLLNYVLNVIEDQSERAATLATAWAHARSALVVSARLTWDRRKLRGEAFRDGVKTSRDTFQHLFSAEELREFVQGVCNVRPVSAAPGVLYCFRNDSDRMAVLARRTLPVFDWKDSQDSKDFGSALASAVTFAEERGRAPLFEEIPPETLPILGMVSAQELARLIAKSADPARLEEGARRATLDALLYLGIDVFNGRAPYNALPVGIRADIRKHFASYKEACRRADRLLIKLRDATYLRGAMRNSVGKLTPTALYVHRRAINSMPVVLRLYEHCGAVAAGRPEEFTLIKLHHDKPSVSWLSYPEFDSDPHPKTAWSYSVSLPEFDTSYTEFLGRTNRPLLHRKEEFLGPDDPHREKYTRLTKQELKAGLYANPHLIGTEKGWEQELEQCGVELRGHRLVSRRSDN